MATVPTQIGQFDVLRQLGSGGMGAVYLGRDAELDRQVAIKVIREEVQDQEVLDRFFREARAAAALRHPNIITIYASGLHGRQPYMVMEFVDGESFGDIIKARRSLSLAQKLSYLEQVCAGLYVAHRAGIVHRDIKPANVMVDRDGVVRILDFGIARVEGSAITQDGMLVGSINYMSPEQMLGRPIDHRSDIFSVGSLAYELITYKQAFKGGLNDGLLQRLPYEDPPPLHEVMPDLPYAVEEIIMRALQKAPDSRYQDLSEMRTALLGVIQAPPPPLALRTAETEGTVVLPKNPEPEPREPIGPLTPPSQYMAVPPSVTLPPPSAFMTSPHVAAPPVPVGRADFPPAGAGSGMPIPPTWGIRKKLEPAGTPLRTPAEPRPSPVVQKVPTATSRPPTTRTAASAAAPRSGRRRWMLAGGAAVALLAGAVAAVPSLTGPEPTPLHRERPGIEAALERYRVAYRNRDLSAVATAFPTLPESTRQKMQHTFENCLVYEVVFDGVQMQVTVGTGAQAEVTLRSTHTCTPQSDGPQTTTLQNEAYALRKDGETWVITGVKALAGGRRQ